jgi:hypothetical protein
MILVFALVLAQASPASGEAATQFEDLGVLAEDGPASDELEVLAEVGAVPRRRPAPLEADPRAMPDLDADMTLEIGLRRGRQVGAGLGATLCSSVIFPVYFLAPALVVHSTGRAMTDLNPGPGWTVLGGFIGASAGTLFTFVSLAACVAGGPGCLLLIPGLAALLFGPTYGAIVGFEYGLRRAQEREVEAGRPRRDHDPGLHLR